jgi:hypothetical protein
MDILVFTVCFLINSVIADWLMASDILHVWSYGILIGLLFVLLPIGPIGGTFLATCMYIFIRRYLFLCSFYKAAVYAGFVYLLFFPFTSIALNALWGVPSTDAQGHSRVLYWLTFNKAWIEEGMPIVTNGNRTVHGYLADFASAVLFFLTFFIAAVVAHGFRRLNRNRTNS